MADIKSHARRSSRIRTDLVDGSVSYSRTDGLDGQVKSYSIVIGGGDTNSRAEPRSYEITFSPKEWEHMISIWDEEKPK